MKNKEYVLPHFSFESKGKADPSQIILGKKFRITMLTDRFFRFEYSKEGMFSDLPTQVFWHRRQETPKYEVSDVLIDRHEHIKIKTDFWTIIYKPETPFARQTLKIFNDDVVYQYGDEVDNLKGTARTLDRVDGEVELEDGLFSKEGYVIIDDTESLVFKDHWIHASDKEHDFYFFGYGKDYKLGLHDFYKVVGYTPMIPRYILGNWWSRYWDYQEAEMEELLDEFEKRNIPLSVCIIDMDWHLTEIDEKYGNPWTGYTWDRNNFKEPEKFLKKLKDRKLFNALNLHPADGFRAFEDCYLKAAEFMGVDIEKEEPVEFDCSDPKFMNVYFQIHNDFENQGVDFWWIDWQQGSKSKVKNLDPLWALNHYHFMDSKKDENKRGFIFSRWPGLGGNRYPIGFSGDTHATWESLEFQPYFTSTASNVGFGWWSHDIGGHYHGYESDEHYTRWVQLGVFSPIMRLHSSQNYYFKREPWRFNAEVERVVTKYMQLRHQLIPYIYTHAHTHSKGDLPLVTPLYYKTQKDEAYDHKYRNMYYFGSELLVSPFVSKKEEGLNHSTENVWLPDGLWFDFFKGLRYLGNKEYTLYGTLEDMNVFAKAGAIIPLAEHLEENHISLPDTLETHIFPFDNNEFSLYEDDGITQDYEKGIHSSTNFKLDVNNNKVRLEIKVNDTNNVIPEKRNYKFLFRSVSPNVKVKGANSYEYNKETNTLEVLLYNLEGVVELDFSDDIFYVDYEYKYELTKFLDETRFLTDDLTLVGYYENKYNKNTKGLLSKEPTLKEFEKQVSELKISNKLQKAIQDFIKVAKVNGDN